MAEVGGKPVEGGCLCGAVRWRYSGPPNWQGICHCESCRKNTASPATAFIGVPLKAFEWTGAEPGYYNSSPGVRRSFCPTCGTPVAFYSERFADEIHVYAASLDNPETFTPEAHYFAEEALPWSHELVPPETRKSKNRSR